MESNTSPAPLDPVVGRALGAKVAALFVESGGHYFGLPNVVPYDAIGQQFFTAPNQPVLDARQYAGPWPVVAHPPCQRWGRFWHGSTRKPHQFKLGDDGGCFAAALGSVREWGGGNGTSR